MTADLGGSLSAVAQVTGNGGEDFDANISWAYVGYDINDEWSVQAGRQRLPLFFYSDFIDVAYTYHWIRPPELSASFLDTFEGVKVAYTPTMGDWSGRFQVYFGSGDEEVTGFDASNEDGIGFTAKMSNDWLQLRASYFSADTAVDFGDEFAADNGGLRNPFLRNGEPQATDENPNNFEFYGLAAHATFDNIFVVGELTLFDLEEPLGTDGGVLGFESGGAWYISSGIPLR